MDSAEKERQPKYIEIWLGRLISDNCNISVYSKRILFGFFGLERTAASLVDRLKHFV